MIPQSTGKFSPVPKIYAFWSSEEDEILKKWYRIASYTEISRLLPKRTKWAVKKRAIKLNLLK